MPRKPCRFLFLMVMLLPFACLGQTTIIDSLKADLTLHPANPAHLNTLLLLCDQKESLPGDSMLKYALQARDIAQALQLKDQLMLADYYILLSRINKGKLDSASAQCSKALQVLTYENNKDLFIKYTLQKARLYIKTAHYKECLKLMFELLDRGEKAGDPVARVYAMNYIGWTHMEMEQLPEALSWFYKAEEELNSSMTNLNYAPLYSNMAAVLDDLGKRDSAVYYIKKSIAAGEKNQSLSYLANALAIQADIYVHLDKPDAAEASLNRAIKIRRLIGDPFFVLSDMGALANLYSTINKPQEGIKLCEEGITLARQYHFIPKELYLSESLAENYKAAGDYKNYSATLKNIIALKDTIYQNNTHTALADFQAKYETKEKENTINEQKYRLTVKNYFIYAVSGLLFATLAGFFALFLYRRNRERLRLKEIEIDNQRKSLEEIEKARQQERRRILADLHDDLGSGLSSIRIMSDLMEENSSQQELVRQYSHKISDISRDLAQGMHTIIWALNSENSSFGNLYEYIGQYGQSFFENSGIQFHLVPPGEFPEIQFNGAKRKNLFLSVKESLHNTLKHSKGKNAWVEFEFTGQSLEIRISDDGIGFNHASAFGNGLKNIQKRMEEIGGTATVENGNGVLVRLRLPLLPPSDRI